MYIHLKWDNKNTRDVSVNIYRSLTTIDRNNPGTPLATVSGDVEEYFDRTVTQGITYNYIIQFVNGTNKATSRNYTFTANYQRGPGNNVPVVGNDEYGFMGMLTFGGLNSILDTLGIGREVTNPTDNPLVTAYKYSLKGEVYYLLYIGGSQVNATNALTFAKRAEPLPVTFDGINYLASLPDYKGDGWSQTDYTTKPPVGDRSMATRLTLPYMWFTSIRGIPGEELGCIHSITLSFAHVSATAPSADRFACWRGDLDNITHALTLSSSYAYPVILKLVE